MMRTTLDIEPALLDKVIEATGEGSKSKAVSRALKEYVRRVAVDELRDMAGTIQIDDYSERKEEADLRRLRFLDRLREGQ